MTHIRRRRTCIATRKRVLAYPTVISGTYPSLPFSYNTTRACHPERRARFDAWRSALVRSQRGAKDLLLGSRPRLVSHCHNPCRSSTRSQPMTPCRFPDWILPASRARCACFSESVRSSIPFSSWRAWVVTPRWRPKQDRERVTGLTPGRPIQNRYRVAISTSSCSNVSFMSPLVLPEAIAASSASFEG